MKPTVIVARALLVSAVTAVPHRDRHQFGGREQRTGGERLS
jgi:hypothetical protein